MKRSTGNEKARARFRKSTLGAFARSLRDWLNDLLQEPGAGNESGLAPVDTALNGGPAPVRQGDAIAQSRNPFEPSSPPDAWVKMAQEYAPRLLIPPEHGGTPWQYAAGMDEQAETKCQHNPTYPARVEVDKKSHTHLDTSSRIFDEMPQVPASMDIHEKAAPKRPGVLERLSRKLHSKTKPLVPPAQASRMPANESARVSGVSKVSSQPSKRAGSHAINSELHAISEVAHPESRESRPPTQMAAYKLALPAIAVEPLRKRVRSLLQRLRLTRGTQPSQTAKLQLVNAALPAVPSKPTPFALQSAENGSAAINPVSPVPLRNVSRPPQMLERPQSQPPLRAANQENIVADRPPSKSVPATWPSLKFVGNLSERAEIGSPIVERKQKKLQDVAESPKAHSAPSTWSSSAATDDRWPELPAHSPVKAEPVLVLRNAERQRALDLEQRGGR